MIRSYLRGQVKRPEEKSKHAARHHGDDRECQQPIPPAVVLQVHPEFQRHQTLPQFSRTFHPDLDSVSMPADPRPPPPRRSPQIKDNSGVLRRIGANPTRYEAECSQRKRDELWLLCHSRADPVWGEETLTKGFLVKPNGLSLPDANRGLGFGFSAQVLLKKASALISLSSNSSLWFVTTPSHPIHKKPQQPFPCERWTPLMWSHFC